MAKQITYEWNFRFTDIDDINHEWLTKSEYSSAKENFKRAKRIFTDNKNDKYFEIEIQKWVYDTYYDDGDVEEYFDVYPNRQTEDLPKWVNKIIDKLLIEEQV